MSRNRVNSRRRLLIGAGIAACTPLQAIASLMPTPKQTAGPFYPVELPLDDDNDLTRVVGQTDQAEGEIVDLAGKILNRDGRALNDVRIEIWQCDARGRYLHPNDRGGEGRDEKFQGHGHAITTIDGSYRFRTIHPVPYPGRTPHIHVAVFAPGQRPFVSQIYVKNEPRNQDDFLFQSIPVEQQHLVLAEFVPTSNTPTHSLMANFDLIVPW